MKEAVLAAMFLTVCGFVLSVSADSQLPLVYQESESFLDKHQYTWGNTIYITIISPIDNVDSAIKDTITTPIAGPNWPSDPSNVVLDGYSLVETGSDTGIFVGDYKIVKPGEKPLQDSSPVSIVLILLLNLYICSLRSPYFCFPCFDLDSVFTTPKAFLVFKERPGLPTCEK
ncbi:MAG: hypothetical protein LDL06_02205 [Candidatus Nitrosotenuis sp.]|nr:hypothetical protein [Candidatus Nitrosotenuis sp.]